ncbi:MAG: putative motility protein [Phycisphaerae bacterium]
MIGDIAGFSTAMSTARLQTTVAAKVMKMAMQQNGQVASKLLESAMENMQAIVTQFAGDLGNNIDIQA